MASNFLNVYKGADSLKQYYDPDVQPPLPLVEIPDSLNPFKQDGVRIFAKMLTMLPAHNVKSLPALNMLSSDIITDKTEQIVEYSSGSTVISMSIIARVLHGIQDTRAFLSNKTSMAKLRLMQFFDLDMLEEHLFIQARHRLITRIAHYLEVHRNRSHWMNVVE